VTTERFDIAIDEVARQMTEDAPAGSADFRRRVLARIEAEARPWRAAWILTPLAVAAAILMAIFVAGPKGPALRVPVQPHELRRPGPSGPGVTTDAAAVPNDPALREPVPHVAVRLKPDATYSPPRLEALAPAPLDTPPLAVPALSRESIQIEPLNAVAPIDVAPLGVDEVQRRFE
jgi:hypothetical protein